MEHINLLFVALGIFLGTSHLFVQTLPIKYHEKNYNDNAAPFQKDALLKISNSPQVPLLLPASEDTVGMVMFPMLAEGENKVQLPTKPNNTGDRSSDNSSTTSATRQTEMTIAMKNYKTDNMGNYLFAKLPQDSDHTIEADGYVGLKQYMRGNPLQPRAPAAERRSYTIPDSTKYGVCFGSTIYNFPKQLRYLKMRLYHRTFPVRPVWFDLRMEIYTDGDSQECHKGNMTDWIKYTQCAIMRNMRMEYLVPKYPLHQHGGYFFPRNDWI